MSLEVTRAGTIEYLAAWEQQRQIHEAVASGSAPDTVLLLEHPSVYTAGKRTEPWDRPVDGTPVVEVDRGGKITWHGPGQLVGYPIMKLDDRLDVIAYVHRVETMLMTVFAEFGVPTSTIHEKKERRGAVWVLQDERGPDRKLAAIGIRVAQGVTQHGFSINCNPDMAAFDKIVPCGIRDAGVTSLSWELGREVTIDEVLPVVEKHLHLLLPSPATA
nr:lipoyl(octanoyl) transferase LipB [Longispora albida]